MCGRMTLTTDKDDLQSRFGYTDDSRVLFKPRYNIAPSQDSPVVTVKEDNRALVAENGDRKNLGSGLEI